MTRTRVGIWGVFGRGNYGNEATLEALLGHLDPSRFSPVILTEAPERASASHGVPAQLVGPPIFTTGGRLSRGFQTIRNRLAYLRGAFRVVRSLDCVVIAGSGGLELSGAFGRPVEIWALSLAARIRKRAFVLLDVGVERLSQPMARWFVRQAGANASYRSYRDERSRRCMVENGLRAAAQDSVVTDMAFALRPDLAEHRDPDLVAFGVIGHGPGSEAGYDDYVARCAQTIELLISRGCRVTIVVGDEGDIATGQEIADRLPAGAAPVSPAATTSELVHTLSKAAVAVASRYHTLIMAQMALTPVISLGYSLKHQAMLQQLGVPDIHHDMTSFAPAEVVELVRAAMADQPGLSQQIADGVRAARERLDAHWPRVLDAISARDGGPA